MHVTLIIPARYGSSRFPGKPLARLRGSTGIAKTLLQRCIEAAAQVPDIDRVAVATDDRRIADEAELHGTEAVMTSAERRNGTERVAEAAHNMGIVDGIIVNLQGDAPLTPAWFVTDLIATMDADPTIGVATPLLRCDEASLRIFREDRSAGRVGATTVVRALNGDALYFSKEVIPFTAGRTMVEGAVPVFHHVGLYAYRLPALLAYAETRPTPLEVLEGLEQLRFLETGRRIRTVEVESRGRPFWEVNNPEDIPRVERELNALGLE